MENKRIAQMYKYIEERETASVEELARSFDVSEATVRRDLLKMEDMNLITRHYGGAYINRKQKNFPAFWIRERTLPEEKKYMCRYAASLIHEGDTVYIDGGSTVSQMIDYIVARDITVVSQGISNIIKLMQKGISTFVMGGYVDEKTENILSSQTVEEVRDRHFNISFIGADGICVLSGITNSQDSDAYFNKQLIENSDRVIIMADETKFGETKLSRFADINVGTIITNGLVEDFDYSRILDLVVVNSEGKVF